MTPDTAPSGPGYLDANPFALTRERRQQSAEQRLARFEERYGPIVRARMSPRDVARHEAWEAAGKPPSPSTLKKSTTAVRRHRRLLKAQVRRSMLAHAQGGCCYLCGERFSKTIQPTEEHVVPRALGGKRAENVLVACQPCNVAKADREPRPCELIYLRAVNFALANGRPEPRVRVAMPSTVQTPSPDPQHVAKPSTWARLVSRLRSLLA